MAQTYHCLDIFFLLEYGSALYKPIYYRAVMKSVTFYTPNLGVDYAAPYILTTLNTGGPARFSTISFLDIPKNKKTRESAYGTNFKGNRSIDTFCIEITPLSFGREKPGSTLLVYLMVGGVRHTHVTSLETRKEFKQYPTLDKRWHEEMCKLLSLPNELTLWEVILYTETLGRKAL